MKSISVRIGDLVFDTSIYPRKDVNKSHVTAMADALTVGAKLPPIVIDQKNRIIDGKHRIEAHRRLYGEDAEIQAERYTYKTESDALLAATDYNERHGLRLEAFERADVAIRLKNLEVPAAKIALALHVPEQRVQTILLVRTAIAPFPDGSQVPLKRSMAELAGRELTVQEYDANESAPGTSWPTHIQQLNKALRAGLGVKWGADAMPHLLTTLQLLSAIKTSEVA